MVFSVRFRSAIALAGGYPLLAGVDLDIRAGQIVVVRAPMARGRRACSG